MSTVEVRFDRVGRSKACWVAELANAAPATLTREVKRKKVLRSKFVDFEETHTSPEGVVHGEITAGVHTVGYYTYTDTPES